MFLDEVEADVLQKELFLGEQVRTLQEMNSNLNTLIEHKCVLAIAAQVIAHAQEEAAPKDLEENKAQEIQMQNLEGAGAKVVPSINAVKEEKIPLIDHYSAANRELGMVAISYMAGTILKEESMRFKQMVFRATRGKALTYFRDLDS